MSTRVRRDREAAPGSLRRRSRARRGEGERLREEILDATERLMLQTNDADSVSVRAVAEEVGVTPPSIYIHFSNKEELIVQVCERIFAMLHEEIEAALCDACDPIDEVAAIGKAYVRFGLDHPEQYRVLFMVPTPEWSREHIQKSVQQVSGFTTLVDTVQRCIDAGAFREGDAFFYACQLWMGVHGITSLLISKPVFPWPEQEALIDGCIQTLCTGLRPN
jgi:AcrR family transcriptional regulator